MATDAINITGASSSGAGGSGAAAGSAGGAGPSRPKQKRVVVNKYTRHACIQCKKAKTKCEGKPICERCTRTGHDCVWVEDNRKALTRHHEQALRHQNGVLRTEVEALRAELASLKMHISGPPSSSLSPSLSNAANLASPNVASAGLASPLSGTASSPVGSLSSPAPSLVHSVSSNSNPQVSTPATSQGSSSSIPTTSTSALHLQQSSQAQYSDHSDQEAFSSGSASASGSGAQSMGTSNHPALHTAYPDIHMREMPSDSVAVTSKATMGNGSGKGGNSAYERPPGRDPFFGEGGMGMGDPSLAGNDFSGSDEDASDSNSGSHSNSDDGSDMDSDYDSDGDVDKALVAPTKTLYLEADDLHLYGLTSVFRLGLRRRTSAHTVRGSGGGNGEHRSRNGHKRKSRSSSQGRPPSAGGYISSSSHFQSHTRTPRARSRVNSTGSSSRYRSASWKDRDGDVERPRKGKSRRNGKGKGRTRLPREPSPVRTARHVLLVGDTEEDEKGFAKDRGCECQSECWSRWLPKGVPLTRREHDMLLDRLFLFFSSWCMRIIPEFFLRDMHTFLHPGPGRPTSPSALGQAPKLAHYSPFLHNTLLAVATAFSDNPELRKPETRSKFAEEAKGYIEAECTRPSISAVQALSMLASFYSGQGQQTLGFMYFGMSARIAQALGLGADCTHLLRAGRLRPQQLFDRAWCFHMGCAQDACWSLYVGREFGIPLGDSPMDDPYGLVETAEGIGERLDWMTWRGRGSTGHEHAGEETPEDAVGVHESADVDEKAGVPQCRTFMIFLWSCQLMKISRRIMDLMNRLATTDGGTEIKLLVADIDIQLIAWREDLPAELKLTPSNEASALPHKLMMHLAYWWLLILLHRPFYQRQRMHAVDLSFSVGRCNLAAREILGILRLWRKTYGTVRFAPITLIQCAFASGTIYILQAMQASMGRRPATVAQATALDNVHEIVSVLRESGQSWECATRIAEIFEKLLKEQRKALEGGESAKKERRRRRRRGTVTGQGTGSSGAASMSPEISVPGNQQPEVRESSETISPSNVNDVKIFAPPEGAPPSFPFFLPFGRNHQHMSHYIDSPTTDSEQYFPQSGHDHGNGHPNSGDATNNVVSQSNPAAGHVSDDSSDSQYVSADDQDHPMSNSEGVEGEDANDFSAIYNAEIDMDSVMPGMGLFDPTGLTGMGSLNGMSGMGLAFNGMGVGMGMGVGGMGPTMNMDYMVPGSYSMQHFMPYGNHASGMAGSMASTGHGGGFNPYAEMDFTSDGEDRALFDVIAALNNESQQQHRRF